MAGFAVIDTETTGFGRLDRVIEVAVVHLDARLGHQREWSTLINPGRDLGAAWVHGITARELLTAPPFEDVAPELLGFLDGRILVGHNLAFDVRMLNAELERQGLLRLPDGLCTMALVGGSLADACSAAGIRSVPDHSALGDARATAQLLRAHWQYLSPTARRRALGTVASVPTIGDCRSRQLPQATRRTTKTRATRSAPSAQLTDLNGKLVVFTGDSCCELPDGTAIRRPVATRLARAAGLRVAGEVSRAVDFVVAADVDSMSKRAKQARQKNVPIISELDFWKAIGIAVRPRRQR